MLGRSIIFLGKIPATLKGKKHVLENWSEKKYLLSLEHTLQKREVYAWWNDLEKHFKICHFLEYENPHSFCFHFVPLNFPPNECPGLCQHRPRAFIRGENKIAWNEKWKKNYVSFRFANIWQMLKCFSRSFHQA